MEKVLTFLDSDRQQYQVPASEEPAFMAEMQAGNVPVTPVETWRDPDGDTYAVPSQEREQFVNEMQTGGVPVEPLRMVRASTANGMQIFAVPDSQREAFLADYRQEHFTPDHKATQSSLEPARQEAQRAEIRARQAELSSARAMARQRYTQKDHSTAYNLVRDPVAGIWDAIRYGGAQLLVDAFKTLGGDPGASHQAAMQRAEAGYEQPATEGFGGEVLHGAGEATGGLSRMALLGPAGAGAEIGLMVLQAGQQTYENLLAQGQDPTKARLWALGSMAAVGVPMIVAQRVGGGKAAQTMTQKAIAALNAGQRAEVGAALLKILAHETGVWGAAGAATGGAQATLQNLSGENPQADIPMETLKGAVNYAVGALLPGAIKVGKLTANQGKAATAPKPSATATPQAEPPTIPERPTNTTPVGEPPPSVAIPEPTATAATAPFFQTTPEEAVRPPPVAVPPPVETALPVPPVPEAANKAISAPTVNAQEPGKTTAMEEALARAGVTTTLPQPPAELPPILPPPPAPIESAMVPATPSPEVPPIEAVQPVAKAKKAKKAKEQTQPEPDQKPRAFFRKPNLYDGTTPVLDKILDEGGIAAQSKMRHKGDEYDGMPSLGELGGFARVVRGGSTGPAEMAQMLYDAKLIRDPTPDAMYEAIRREMAEYRTAREGNKIATENAKQAAQFDKATAKPKSGTIPVPVETLKLGDTVTVKGERLAVTGVQEDGMVVLQDGRKFGTQLLIDGQIIYVELLEDGNPDVSFDFAEAAAPQERSAPTPTPRPVEPGALFSEDAMPFNLDAGTVEAQRTVADVEAARRAARAQEQAQGDMFAQPELPAVTRDDSGRVIPLSERFNPETPDIRNSAQPQPLPDSPRMAELRAKVATEYPQLAGQVEVVPTGADFPESVKTQAQKLLGEGGHLQVEAVYHDGQVYLVGNRVTPERVGALVLHEVATHAGLRKALGEERFGALLDSIAQTLTPEEIAQIRARDGIDMAKPAWRRQGAEEWLARAAEHADVQGSLMRRVWDKIVAAWNATARVLGVERRYTSAEVRELVRMGLREAQHARGKFTPAGETAADAARFSAINSAQTFLNQKRKAIVANWKAREPIKQANYQMDAAEASARTLANVVAHNTEGVLRRAMGRRLGPSRKPLDMARRYLGLPANDPAALDRVALTVLHEAGNSRATLANMVARAEADLADPRYKGNHDMFRLYHDGAKHALAHYYRLQSARAEMYRAYNAQYNGERQWGFDTKFRENYVYHPQEREPYSDMDAGGTGTTGNFLRERTAGDTFLDSLEGGVRPKSLDAVDLLRARIERGQMLINKRAWLRNVLPTITDTSTGLPIITTPFHTNPQTGRAWGNKAPRAPAGYELLNLGGENIAVHEGYAGPIKSLTGESAFQQSYWLRTLQEANALAKHITLVMDTFHLGRLAYWLSTFTGGNPNHRKGLLLLDYSAEELRRMAQANEIDARALPRLLVERQQVRDLIHQGYNLGSSGDALYHAWVDKIPISGPFSKWLFGSYARGAMARAGVIEYSRLQRANPGMPRAQVARQVAKDLNNRFGNLGRQGWFGGNKTAMDLGRLIFLAPNWNIGLINSELDSWKQAGRLPVDLAFKRRVVVGTQLRAAGTMMLAAFAANQLINWITRGKPTWENEEEGFDSKMSAWVPDEVGNGPGFFLSPFALPMEISHQLLERLERTDRLDNAFSDVVRYKLSSLSRAARVWWVREDGFGKATKGTLNTLKVMASEGVPLPISGSSIYRGAQQAITGQPSERFAGQFQKQIMATFGVKARSAPDQERRISELARQFREEAGIAEEPGMISSEYTAFAKATQLGNTGEMADELSTLRQRYTDPEILDHFAKAYATRPFSGSRLADAGLYATLNAEQRRVFDEARQKRIVVATKAVQYVLAHPPEEGSQMLNKQQRIISAMSRRLQQQQNTIEEP